MFETDCYDMDAIAPYKQQLWHIVTKRQLDASEDWRLFGENLSGLQIEAFDLGKYQWEYTQAPKERKDETFIGKFILAAMAQKSMVTNKIYKSGNLLAGYSVDYDTTKGFQGIQDFKMLVDSYMNR